jgi:hypothetical protein
VGPDAHRKGFWQTTGGPPLTREGARLTRVAAQVPSERDHQRGSNDRLWPGLWQTPGSQHRTIRRAAGRVCPCAASGRGPRPSRRIVGEVGHLGASDLVRAWLPPRGARYPVTDVLRVLDQLRDGSLHAEGLPPLEGHALISVPTGRLLMPCAAFRQLAHTDALRRRILVSRCDPICFRR